MDWTDRKRQEAEATLMKWREATEFIQPSHPSVEFIDALSDDLNSPLAISLLAQQYKLSDYASLKAASNMLGLLSEEGGEWFWSNLSYRQLEKSTIPDTHPILFNINRIFGGHPRTRISSAPLKEAYKRMEEKKVQLEAAFPEIARMAGDIPFSFYSAKNFERLSRLGVVEAITSREKAKARRDFVAADQIRMKLSSLGIDLIDQPSGTRWYPNRRFERDDDGERQNLQ